MRDILVLAPFVFVLPFAVRFTWVAVLLWTWISLMNPHKLAFGFAYAAPFAAVAAGAALISLLFNKDRFRVPASPAVLVLGALVSWMGLTTLFALQPELSWIQFSKVLKIQLMTLVALVALRERKHIELFVWINVLSIGFYGFKGGLFTLLTGGNSRVWGPPGGFIEGNNEIALALVVTIPLMSYLRMTTTLTTTRPSMRLGLLAMMVLSIVAALGTQSRGAFLALLAMGIVVWIRSNRKLVTGLVISIAAITVVAFMPSTWEERMATIQTYQTDGSAMGRINAWWTAINLANDRVTGGGFEIYTPEIFAQYAPDPNNLKVAHSIYFSVLGEHGYVGLLLFLALGWLAFRIGSQVRAAVVGRPDAQWVHQLAQMCCLSLVGYAVGGAFLSLAYFDLPYNILVILLVSQRWLGDVLPQKVFANVAPPRSLQA